MQIFDEGPHVQTVCDITLVNKDAGPVLRLRGEVDAAVVAIWDATKRSHGRARVAVDVSGMTFLDACGLRSAAVGPGDRGGHAVEPPLGAAAPWPRQFVRQSNGRFGRLVSTW